MIIPEKKLFGSLAIVVTKINGDCRPMTLRHQVSLILRFGRLVDHGQQTCKLTLDAELCAVPFWGFCYYR